jgi:hypothetical protein
MYWVRLNAAWSEHDEVEEVKIITHNGCCRELRSYYWLADGSSVACCQTSLSVGQVSFANRCYSAISAYGDFSAFLLNKRLLECALRM